LKMNYPPATPGVAMVALGAGMLAGAWLAVAFASAPPSWACVLAAGIGMVAGLRGRWAAAGAAWGFALAGSALALALADRLDPALEGAEIEFIGVVADLPQREGRRVVLTLRLESPGGLPARARISWYEPGATPAAGERWRFRARLQRPRGLVNTGSGSREAWLLRQGIGATGYASGAAAGELLATGADPVLRLRARSAATIAEKVADPRAAAVLTAITLGFRGGLDRDTRDALARTGTGHLLAISGLHIGLAAAAGGFAAGFAGRRLGAGRRPARDWAAMGALAAALGYCILAGMPVSARRAMLMTAAGLLALVCRRGGSVAAGFGGALALVLATDPLAVLDPGLWLSFGAVATIIAVVAGRRAAAAWWRAMLRIQAALFVGMGLFTAAWFGQVSLIAPVANLVAVPWFSVLVVPPALAAVMASWFLPPLGTALLLFAAQAVEYALLAIEGLARAPWAARSVTAPGQAALLLAAAGAAWCLLPRPAPGRLLAPLMFLPLLQGGEVSPPPGTFELRVFDVGHGLSVLVRTRSRAMLFDAGPSWPGGDAAEWSVLPALRALGVRELDMLVLSHGHADHVGGASSLRRVFPGIPELAGFGAEREGSTPCRSGDSWEWDGVRFSLLHPGEGFRGGKNDGSCVLLIEGPGGRALLTGDIEARAERALLSAHRRLPVDVVIAPHHGSRTSSGPPLVAATRPAWVVFSTNWRNRWGFPADSVVRRWQHGGATPLSTDRHGEIVIRFEAAGPSGPELGRRRDCRAWLDCG
jgi:competence protein ComEC